MARTYDLPIECLVRRTGTRLQLRFATEAAGKVPPDEAFVLAPSRYGVRVMARNEDGLAPPVRRLRELYGASVEVGPPVVRLIEGVPAQEPVMHVRISLAAGHLEAVRAALLARGASEEEASVRAGQAALRYEAPLARLIGLPGELLSLTRGAARYWIVLSHYATVA